MWQVVCKFHSVAVKDTLSTVRLLTKFEVPAQASNNNRVEQYF